MLFPIEYHGAIAFFKDLFFKGYSCYLKTSISNFTFKKKPFELCINSFVNLIKIIKTPLTSFFPKIEYVFISEVNLLLNFMNVSFCFLIIFIRRIAFCLGFSKKIHSFM